MSKTNGRTPPRSYKPETPFVPHSRRLLESDAWRSLAINERRMLDCLEIENMKHSGKTNGDLICPSRGFGIDRHAVKPSNERLTSIGLLKIKHGCSGVLGFGRAHRYGLTYLPTWNGKWVPPTDEWADWTETTVVQKPAPLSRNSIGAETRTTVPHI
jgi:hypothetical protein